MKRNNIDHLNLLCDIGELAVMLAGSNDIASFLQDTVVMVAQHLKADVGSIYLYEENSDDLVLKATKGLNPKAVDVIRMKIGEGLVGTTMQHMKPIREGCVCSNPHFKYFVEADEDCFESFLAVPIQKGVEKIGVLVVQHERKNYFTEIDVMALRAIASQLAGAIENARILMEFQHNDRQAADADLLKKIQFVKGKVGAEGFAYAPAFVLKADYPLMSIDKPGIDFLTTLDDFHEAVRKTRLQIQELQGVCAERLPESAALIFAAHTMMLKDPKFVDKMAALIKDGSAAAAAVNTVAQDYCTLFSASPHAYIQEKVYDIKDLANRILKNLAKNVEQHPDIKKERIVIAPELYPSDVLKLVSENVQGIIVVSGGVTSHVSILSRSLQIPLVIVDRMELIEVPDDTPVLIDAEIGNVYINPSKNVVERFEQRNKIKEVEPETHARPAATVTKDGTRIAVLANINILSEIAPALKLKAEGVGLYRTEFPFLIRTTFPSEEEQYPIYKHLFDGMCGKPVTIRTLDIGGEKAWAYEDKPVEANPELGLKSIRFALNYRDLFEQQLRAILRAGADATKLRIMFPLISSLDEFRVARAAVLECLDALHRESLPHCPDPEIGTMIEVPSVIGIITDLAREADFFSIGTNDFVQYMLAVDRANERVAAFYCPEHPAVLRGLAEIVDAAVQADKDVSICGEMAHVTEYIPFLIGIGIRSFSVDPHFLSSVQRTVAQLTISHTQSLAKALLSQATIEGVRNILQNQTFA